MSMFLCARCDGMRDSDDGADEYGKTGMICDGCLDRFPLITASSHPPPIPVRDFDWIATTEEYEPGEPMGFGATRGEAIRDLIENHLEE